MLTLPSKFRTNIVCALLLATAFFGQVAIAQSLDNLKDKKPFDAGGSIAFNTSYFATNNNTFPFGRTSPFQWNIVGTPWVSFYEFRLPFTFTIGRQNSSFEHPFYQFGVSPSYKWITLHGGHRNMIFNPYTLNGHTFLGVGMELNPKRFRFSAMWGQLQKATEFDTTSTVFEDPTYKRFGYGAKIGYGTKTNNIDIMFFKAKDKVSSIIKPPLEQRVRPGENLTIGLSTKQKLGKYFNWYADGGMSLYTRDLTASELYYGENSTLQKYSWLFRPNLSSRVNYALKTGLDVRVKNFSMGTMFERVMPQYETMGSYFFANDFNMLQISPSLVVLKNKVRFTTNYNMQWNNLQNTRLQTTYKSNGLINIDIAPKPKYGINMTYNNFYIFQGDGTVPLVDSVAIDMMTHVVTLVPRLTFIKPEFVQNYIVSFNYQTLNDNNPSTALYNETNSINVNLNGTYNWVKKKNTFNAGLNFLRVTGTFFNNFKYGFSLGYSTRLLKDKVNLRLQGNFSINNDNGAFNGHSESLSLQFGYTITKMHRVSFNSTVLNNSFRATRGYFEFRGNLSYVFTIAGIDQFRKKNKTPVVPK